MPQDVRAEFSRAAGLHRQGKLDEAIEIYRRLLKAHPGSFEIARLLVFAQLQAGRAKDALMVARRAREAHPSNPHAHVLLGASLQAARQWDKSLAAFEAAAVLDPALTEAHYLAGNVLGILGRHAEAVARFDRVLALDPRTAEALANRAVAYSRLGCPEAALRDLVAVIRMQPWEARHWIAKAGTLLELGRLAEASAAADEAIRLAPKAARGHALKARGLMGLGRLAEARGCLETAVQCAPDDAAVHEQLICVLRLLEDFPAALHHCDRALAAFPGTAVLLQHRAEVRRALEDFEGAMADVEATLAAAPRLAPAFVTQARLLADLGREAEIRPALDRALECDPQEPNALFLKAADDLAHGRWAEGWAGYEARESLLPPPFAPLPFQRWDGQGKPEPLIVLGEQGIGDTLLFARLVRLLADDGVRTVLLTRPGLVPLLRNLDARVSVVSDLSQIDTTKAGLRWIALGSLPHLLWPDPAQWPATPYLTAAPERIAKWAHLRGEGVFSIGINWQGSPSRNVDVGRSVPLAAFAPLAQIAGVRLVCLQHGAGLEQLNEVPFADAIARPADGFGADGILPDAAAMLQHLDLLITSDAALANLCGARRRPALVALRAVPDWRWGHEGERSVFFPSLRLFRQSRPGDWDEVFARIAAAVRSTLAGQGR